MGFEMKQIGPMWDRMYVSPMEAAFGSAGTNIRYLHARYALCAEDPVSFACSFSSFASEFFRYIDHNWELLVRDIAVMRGASPGQQKPVTVVSNDAQRRFFFGQTESFDEVKRLFGVS